MNVPEPSEQNFESGKILSPFAQSGASLPDRGHRHSHLSAWVKGLALLVLLLGIGLFFATRYLNDPYRTLEPFPVGKYLDSHRALAGSRFKAELRVEADLGWKEGVGRLMAFTTPNDAHPIVVLIPPALSGIYFTKGQTYLAELEVKEGGLIHANFCRKN